MRHGLGSPDGVLLASDDIVKARKQGMQKTADGTIPVEIKKEETFQMRSGDLSTKKRRKMNVPRLIEARRRNDVWIN
jgi:hypothetical protein